MHERPSSVMLSQMCALVSFVISLYSVHTSSDVFSLYRIFPTMVHGFVPILMPVQQSKSTASPPSGKF